MSVECEGVEWVPRRGRGTAWRRGVASRPTGQAVDLVANFLNHGKVAEPAGRKVRSLAGLAALTALKSPTWELKVHVDSALEAGASREEVLAVIVEASLYAGFDAAHAGLEAVLTVLDGSRHTSARAP